jgi:hypothetical protein
MYHSLSKRKILSVCVAASLLSHIISVVFLQKFSFWDTASHAPHVATSCLALMDKEDPGKILKESLQPRVEGEGQSDPFPMPHPEISNLPTLQQAISPMESAPLPIVSGFSMIPVKYEFVEDTQKPVFTLPKIEPLNLFEYLPKDLITLAAHSRSELLQPSPTFLANAPMPLKTRPASKKASPTQATYAATPLLTPALDEASVPKQTALPEILAELPGFPTLEDLGVTSCSNFFDAEIVFSPLENEEGYIFALTLVPEPGLNLPKIRQHYSFMIDRSNSIQKERLSAVKSAIIAALEELNIDDSFNIIAFDSKIEKLAPAPLPVTSASRLAARKFMDQVQLGSFFSSTNLTKPLMLTAPTSSNDGEHSAILFTDGESLGKKTAQRELALDWTRYNSGRVSLFAIGVGGDPHLATLETVTALNRGKVLYPPTKKGIKRKLLKLIKTIGSPIATNMTITALPRSSPAKISLFSLPRQTPSLYLNEPYVILGTIDKLDNFILFVQGRLKDQWLNIKKNISFVNAKKGDASLKAQVSLQQAYKLYEKYLYDLNPAHLAEAKTLLEPHALEVAFQ